MLANGRSLIISTREANSVNLLLSINPIWVDRSLFDDAIVNTLDIYTQQSDDLGLSAQVKQSHFIVPNRST